MTQHRKVQLVSTPSYIFPFPGLGTSHCKKVLGRLEHSLGKLVHSLDMMEYSLDMKVHKLDKKVCNLGMMEYSLDMMVHMMDKKVYNLGRMVCSLGMMVYNLDKLVVNRLEYKLDNNLDISLAQSILRLDRRLVLQHHRDKYRSSTQHPKIQFCSSFHNHSLVLQDSSHMKV